MKIKLLMKSKNGQNSRINSQMNLKNSKWFVSIAGLLWMINRSIKNANRILKKLSKKASKVSLKRLLILNLMGPKDIFSLNLYRKCSKETARWLNNLAVVNCERDQVLMEEEQVEWLDLFKACSIESNKQQQINPLIYLRYSSLMKKKIKVF